MNLPRIAPPEDSEAERAIEEGLLEDSHAFDDEDLDTDDEDSF